MERAGVLKDVWLTNGRLRTRGFTLASLIHVCFQWEGMLTNMYPTDLAVIHVGFAFICFRIN